MSVEWLMPTSDGDQKSTDIHKNRCFAAFQPELEEMPGEGEKRGDMRDRVVALAQLTQTDLEPHKKQFWLDSGTRRPLTHI